MEKSYSLNNKKFKSTANSNSGEVSEKTIFEYFEKDNLIWAYYHGGQIVRGQIVGTRSNQSTIEFAYQHVNKNNEILTGNCRTNITIDATGKLLLNEQWKWSCGDCTSGESTLIEI